MAPQPQPESAPPQYSDENLPHNRAGEQQQQQQPARGYGAPGESEYEQSQVAAAGASGKSGMPMKKVAAGGVDDDHFADVELDDGLLPGH